MNFKVLFKADKSLMYAFCSVEIMHWKIVFDNLVDIFT